MPYEHERASKAFESLDKFFKDNMTLEGADQEVLEQGARLYLAAHKELFRLMGAIMEARLPGQVRTDGKPEGTRFLPFLEIYKERCKRLEGIMRDFLHESPQDEGDYRGMSEQIAEFLEGIREGAIHKELTALAEALGKSSGQVEDLRADEAATTTVVNSLKDHIKRRVKWKWMEDVLHAINEVIAIVRGVP